MNRKTVLFSLILILLTSPIIGIKSANSWSETRITEPATTYPTSTYENITTHEGDLIIDGTQTYVIENCTYIQTGNIYVRDWAKLLVKNAEIEINQTTPWQYELSVEDYGTLELKDVILMSDREFNFYFVQHSKANFNNTSAKIGEQAYSYPIICFFDFSKATIYQSNFMELDVCVRGYSDVSIKHSTLTIIDVSAHAAGTPTIKFEQSDITWEFILMLDECETANVNNLEPGFHEFSDLKVTLPPP